MYNSNHTLTTFSYSDSTNTTIIQETKTNVESSLVINRRRGRNSHAAGREKVIETQLNINNRLELSRLQGVDYSYSNLFAVIEPILLPEVLETVKKRGQNNLHQMLLATAPDLLLQKSCSERKNCPEKDATIKELDAEYEHQTAELTEWHLRSTDAITAEKLQLIKDLASIEDEHEHPVQVLAKMLICVVLR